MIKNDFVKKLFTVVFTAFIICVLPAFSAENNESMLKEILINPINDNSYSLNAYFTNEYKNKAFIEKADRGEYYIYLPQVSLNNKNTKITYFRNSDKKNIKLLLDEKPLSYEDDLSSYIRIIVSMNADYSLKIISKTTDEDKMLLFFAKIKNAASLILFAILGLCAFIMFKIFHIAKKNFPNIAHTAFPSNFRISPIKEYNNTFEKNALKKYISQNSSTNPLKVANRDSFKCFDIKSKQDDSYSQNSIEEIINEKLDIPFADDVIKTAKKLKQHDKDGNEILSMININDNKGFYLSLTDDCMSLYGFNNDNITLIKKFKDLVQLNLQARFYDTTPEGEVYIVRLDSYKSMIEFSNNSIRELVVL